MVPTQTFGLAVRMASLFPLRRSDGTGEWEALHGGAEGVNSFFDVLYQS